MLTGGKGAKFTPSGERAGGANPPQLGLDGGQVRGLVPRRTRVFIVDGCSFPYAHICE